MTNHWKWKKRSKSLSCLWDDKGTFIETYFPLAKSLDYHHKVLPRLIPKRAGLFSLLEGKEGQRTCSSNYLPFFFSLTPFIDLNDLTNVDSMKLMVFCICYFVFMYSCNFPLFTNFLWKHCISLYHASASDYKKNTDIGGKLPLEHSSSHIHFSFVLTWYHFNAKATSSAAISMFIIFFYS